MLDMVPIPASLARRPYPRCSACPAIPTHDIVPIPASPSWRSYA